MMLDYVALLVLSGIAALSLSMYFMHTSGYDGPDKHTDAH